MNSFLPQPGDTVKVRDWDDMANEFGVDSLDCIRTPGLRFYYGNHCICGNTYKVISCTKNTFSNELLYELEGLPGIYIGLSCLTLASPPIPVSTVSFDDLMKGAFS